MTLRRWMPAVCAVMIASLALAAAGEAQTLKVSRAASANKRFAKLLCNSFEGEETCVASRPGRCNRIAQRRVRCGFFLTLDFDDGSRGRCLNLIEWYVRGESPRLYPHYLGIRSCAQLRPPQTEEPTS